jgi:hypothetical protein
MTHCTGIILYLEYQSVCSFVRIGSPAPLFECFLPPPGTGGGTNRLRVRGRGQPIRTTGETAWHSVCTVEHILFVSPLCVVPSYSHINIGTILPSSSESIELFIEDRAFSRLYDLAPPPPPSVGNRHRRHTGILRKRYNLLTGEGKGRSKIIRLQGSLVF